MLAVRVEGAPARLGQRGRGRGGALRGDEALDERGLEALRVGARGLERGAQLDDLELLRLARRGGLVEGARAAPLGLGEPRTTKATGNARANPNVRPSTSATCVAYQLKVRL